MAFGHILNQINSRIDNEVKQASQSQTPIDIGGRMASLYTVTYSHFSQFLSTYFGILNHMLVMIDESELNRKAKMDYADLLKAYISEPEIGLVAYRCYAEPHTDFCRLVETYCLLKEVPKNAFIGNDAVIQEMCKTFPDSFSAW